MTQFTVKKIALVSTLKRIVSFMPKTSSEARESMVKVIASDSKIELVLSQPSVHMQSGCEAIVADVGTPFVISGRKLLEIATTAETDVQFTFDGTRVEVSSGASKWLVPVFKANIPHKDVDMTPTITFDSYDLITGLNTVKYAAATDSVRPSLFMVDVEDGRVRACNGYRYHEVNIQEPGLTFQLPGAMIDGFISVLRFFDGDVGFMREGNRFYFQNNLDVFSMTKITAKFPDLDKILVRPLKSQSPALLKSNRSDLLNAIKKVRVASDEDYPYIEMHISKSEVLFRCSQNTGAEAVSSVAASWDNKPRIANFDAVSLQESIKAAWDEDIEMRFGRDTKDRRSPLVIEGDGAWSMLNQVKVGRL